MSFWSTEDDLSGGLPWNSSPASPPGQPASLLTIRAETIWVNAVLCIVFECIAIYCHIAIFDWILVKTFHIGIWVLAVK